MNTAVSLNNEQQETLARVQLHESWKSPLAEVFLQPYMANLRQFLAEQKKLGKTIYPPANEYFNALNTTPLAQVKVVILGQDPYHGVGQAHGLCFSVRRGITIPPSLRNVYRELQTDVNAQSVNHGDLSSWAEQGVLLLNSVLTVEAGLAASHQGRGWEQFTDEVIKVVNEQCQHVVFLLWGSYAQKKGQHIDEHKHLVLRAAHPSPMAANRGGFFGCRHFSKVNAYLVEHNLTPINWQLPL
ncbi:MAG: uracil-DNA glycosylase [Moraxellaceae bacterium]|nr:uracil-DNA glycosylase [Pseudomonadales bacterium]MCB1673523.1 uracil-DNA glycosylase [Pseudomonadales bacterium]MCP5173663.1 uracil-DNA glycosylase [Moraxellaceae bacterium]MCP5178230.1 uracil-DNA glycosylase [Moraxellaceae bacterium]